MEKIKRTFGFILTHPLGKRHVARCLLNFLIWQSQSNLYPTKLIIKHFIKPVRFYARKGLTGLTGNIYTGLHEFDDMMFLLHLLRAGDTFFDIGANAGSYTLLASGVCKANSVALEPVNAAFEILDKNVILNSLQSRVCAINAAAGAKKGTITFTADQDTTNHVLAGTERGTENVVSVPVITVDSLTDNQQPVLIKIDVEGYETEVLKGMADTLDHTLLKAIIIELNGSGARYGFSDNDIHSLLLSKKFSPYVYDPFKRSLIKTQTFGVSNTIYCRDWDFVNDRLQAADPVGVMGELI